MSSRNWARQFAAALMVTSCLVGPAQAQLLNGPEPRFGSSVGNCDADKRHDEVYFGWDKSDITQSTDQTLDQFVTSYNRHCKGGAIKVTAHTDSSGNNDYNQRLSLRRAEAVRNALIQRGISASRITIEAKSENDLAVQTGDGVREVNNRRATLRVFLPPRIAERRTVVVPPPKPVAPKPVIRQAPPPPPPPPKPSGKLEIKVADSQVDNRWGVPEYRHPSQAEHDIIDVRLDEFEATPRLNVEVLDGRSVAARSEPIIFQSYWNYSAWIKRAEIRIFDPNPLTSNEPIAVVPADLRTGFAHWTNPNLDLDAYSYVLRVYDENGEFDQTIRKSFSIVDELDTEITNSSSTYGEDATDLRNIDVRGSGMTFYIPPERGQEVSDVTVFGRPVRQQVNGAYISREIVPPGSQKLNLGYTNETGKRVKVERRLDVPSNDVFLVALGDLTIGKRSDEGRALLAADGEDFDETFATGRGAFYLKGKIQGRYLITAAMDTTEDDIDNLFSNLSDKSPESLLRRIDQNRFYPVYGDDSTFVEDAPTQGRFYVRIEDGNDYLLWGNFLSSIKSSEIAQLDRGLYGAKAVLRSDTSTSHGEDRYSIQGFAADPGTVPAREEFLATGGSVYFLENQDITIGSERVRLEIRDQDTGFVRESIELVPEVDYTVDYIRGRILLSRPVSAIQLSSTVVREGALSGDTSNIVVRYEFTPGLTDIDGYTVGGRAEAWVNDAVRLGITGQQEETEDADQTLVSADVLLRKSDTTFARIEVARTEGAAFSERRSVDGGFTYTDVGEALSTDEANAYHLEGSLGFSDVFAENSDGKVSAYYEKFEEGYSGAGRITEADIERYGVTLATAVSNASRIMAEVDRLSIANQREETTANVDLSRELLGNWSGQVGLRYSDLDDQTGSAQGSGERLDLGVQLDYHISDSAKVYGFGQTTVMNDGTRADNDRGGVGLDAQLTERLSARAEVSDGDGGVGASVGLGLKLNEGEEYYLNYQLDAQRQNTGFSNRGFGSNEQNTVTAGGRKRFNDQVSIYGEERASFGDTTGLTHAYGIDLAPFENWNFGASFEVGDLEENGNIIEREGYTATAGYSTEDLTFGGAFEWIEDTNNDAQRETWLLRTNFGYKVNPDWRALVRYNKAESNSTDGAFFNGDFTEFQIGGAYRPVDNNRVNALIRYTYFEDLPGAEQLSNNGQAGLPAQKSNVFSIDGNVKITDWLTLGGKYGYRKGEVSLSRTEEDFVDSEASLWVARADVHFVKKWDAIAEIRSLDVDTAGNSETGALVGVYRHIGDNAKVGVGYNFTDFSDDLTDLSFDDDGVFLNIVAKF